MKVILVLVAVMVVAVQGRRMSGNWEPKNSADRSYYNNGYNHQHHHHQQHHQSNEMLEVFSGMAQEGINVYMAWSKIQSHFAIFGMNFKAMVSQIGKLYAMEWKQDMKQIRRLVESIPENTIKDTILLILKQGKTTEAAVMHAIKRFDPFHQYKHQQPNYNTHYFSGSVANMVDKVDTLLKKFFEVMDTKYLKVAQKQSDQMIGMIQKMSAKSIKDTILNGIDQIM